MAALIAAVVAIVVGAFILAEGYERENMPISLVGTFVALFGMVFAILRVIDLSAVGMGLP